MTSRKARPVLIASALVLFGLPGVFFASSGLRVEITNSTPDPLVDVELTHPGGTTRLPRIEPGVSATLRVRGPLGFPSPIPIVATFSQQGERSLPLAMRCRPRSIGWRDVMLDVTEKPVHRSVIVSAGMWSTVHVNYRRLGRNAVNPRIGPRRFVDRRHISESRTVIPRRNWPAELSTAAAALDAPRHDPIRGTYDLLEYLAYATYELIDLARGDAIYPHPPDSPIELPIPLLDAVANFKTNVFQPPPWP